MNLLSPINVKWIVLHCSASFYGDVETFNQWHLARGWSMIGYHWVITNCYPKEENYVLKQPETAYDGVVHLGRNEKWCGAHVKGHNWETIGIVVTGNTVFTSKQLNSTAKLCNEIIDRFPNCRGVKGHHEFTNRKTCPNIDMDWFRNYVLPGAYDENNII